MDELIVDALATFRVVRLIQEDSITEPLRDRLEQQAPGWFLELLGCAWCLSPYVAVGVLLAPRWLRRVLALSAVTGLLRAVDSTHAP